jgi:hypothetical protein
MPPSRLFPVGHERSAFRTSAVTPRTDDVRRDDEFSTLLRPAFRPSAIEDVAFHVSVEGGPDAGQAVTIDASRPSRLLVGTSPACDLRLTDREVSRRHAALEIVGRKLRLVDMGSKNGSFVNGVLVADASLDGGETVRVGSTQLRVARVAAPDGAPLPDRSRFGRWLGASTEVRRLCLARQWGGDGKGKGAPPRAPKRARATRPRAVRRVRLHVGASEPRRE